jgi:hypothetical protein
VKASKDNVRPKPLEFSQEEGPMASNPEIYCDLYRDMAMLIGDAATKKLWKAYGGMNVTFPKKLYSGSYVKSYIAANMGTMKPSQMARELSLSDRRIRQLIREIREQQKEEEKNSNNTKGEA